MIAKKRLIDFYNNPRQYGIFYDMFKRPEFGTLFTALGISTENDAHSIDFDYIFNSSGLKTLSGLLHRIASGLVIEDNGNLVSIKHRKYVSWDYVLTQVDKDLIDNVIRIKFLNKWNKLAETLTFEYNPIKPYSMEITDNTADNGNKDIKNTNSYTDEGSNNIDSSGTSNSLDGIYGFNSTEKSNSNQNDSSFDNNSQSTNKSNGSGNSDSNETHSNNIERTINRNGNIGNKSAMELIDEERELLQFQILQVIYSDLDSVLTRSKYI